MVASYTCLMQWRRFFAKPDVVDNVKYKLKNIRNVSLDLRKKQYSMVIVLDYGHKQLKQQKL